MALRRIILAGILAVAELSKNYDIIVNHFKQLHVVTNSRISKDNLIKGLRAIDKNHEQTAHQNQKKDKQAQKHNFGIE
jgi:histidyl-tRNA synthetase